MKDPSEKQAPLEKAPGSDLKLNGGGRLGSPRMVRKNVARPKGVTRKRLTR